jgi:hypothetical protein
MSNKRCNWFQSEKFVLEMGATCFSFLSIEDRVKNCLSVCKIFKSIVHSHHTWANEMYTLVEVREFKHLDHCYAQSGNRKEELIDYDVILKKQNSYFLMKFKNKLGCCFLDGQLQVGVR